MSASGNRQRIFITGGSGYIGSRVATFAIEQGYDVHALSRSEQSDEKLKKIGAVPVRGDLSTLDVLKLEAAAADIVLHLASPQSGGNFTITWDEILRIDGAAVSAMADGLKDSGKPFVVTSGSLVTAPDPTGAETNELSPVWPEEQAPHQRMKAEKYSLETGKNNNIKVSIIRLAPCVYGNGGNGPAGLMTLALAVGEVAYVDEGALHTTFVHVDDAARLYLLAAQKTKAGDIFNASGQTDVTHRQLTEAFSEALGIPTKSLTKEEFTAKFGKFLTSFFTFENRASNAKAKAELGWETKGMGILEDIKSGSYKPVVEGLKKLSQEQLMEFRKKLQL